MTQDAISFANSVREALSLEVDGNFETAISLEPASMWGEFAAFDLQTGTGQQWRMCCRVMQHDIPAEGVDYLCVDAPDPECQLLIVYLCSGEEGVSVLPQAQVLSNRWRSVTHAYWVDPHPFEIHIDPRPRPQLPAAMEVRSEGGKRLSGELRPSSSEAPLVTVMTVVFNGEETIEQTIQSVLHQSYRNIEYIIVDGGSTDGTLDIVNRYAQYIDYWKSEPDKGWLDAMNKGIELAKGELIGAIHANDLYTLEAVQTVIDHAASDPSGEFFYANLEYVAEDSAWVRGAEIRHTWEMIMFGDFFHPTCFVRPEVYRQHGGLNLDYPIAADYDMGVRFWKAGVNFSYIDATLGYFRLGGISSSLFANQWERHLVRVANGENVLWSMMIMLLVIMNFYSKGSLRAVGRLLGLSR